MTELLVRFFPLLVIAVTILVLFLALRLDRRLSRGPYSAGPIELVQPEPAGQERSPWELRAIQDQLDAIAEPGTPVVRRYDLTATVNRLTNAAGMTDPRHQLPITANEMELAAAITNIEHQLGLPPLTEGIDNT